MDRSKIGMRNFEIGSKFEKAVAELFRRMGYDVELNKKVIGSSGADYEIDIYGEKKSFGKTITMAVECKFREDTQKVEKEDIAVFNLKLDELKINEGYMVTNGDFSENARKIAKSYNIELIDGKELKRLFRKYGIPYSFENFNSMTSGPLPEAIKATLKFLDEAGLLK